MTVSFMTARGTNEGLNIISDHFAQAIGAVLRAGSLHFPEAFRDVVEYVSLR